MALHPLDPSGQAQGRDRLRPRDDERRVVAARAEALPAIDTPAFGAAFDRFGDARVVLIGEASHGTSEFYRARARITRHLIEHHGFSIVAVEADWPDAARIDAYVRRRAPWPGPHDAFTRFPTWMWRNRDVLDFADWLRGANQPLDAERRVEFRGLDIYSLDTSLRAVLDYLDKVDPEAAQEARRRYGCLTPWQQDPAAYGRAAILAGSAPCEAQVVATLRDLLEKRIEYMAHDGEGFFDAAQNARLVRSAEKYYRIMYRGNRESWNLRDRHMYETLRAVMDRRGPQAKAVVWAHNSHVGDASATEMGWNGEFNIGELCKKGFGANAVALGFGTDTGTVAAASGWDMPMEVKTVRPSLPGSHERLCHEAGLTRHLLDLRPDPGRADLREVMAEIRLERAIGVVYMPETERWSHYFEADLPRQFDAWIWFDRTSAVTPLPAETPHGADETWPFGL